MEDYLLDQHFAGKPLKCTDEQAARMATEAFYDTPKSIIKELSTRFKGQVIGPLIHSISFIRKLSFFSTFPYLRYVKHAILK